MNEVSKLIDRTIIQAEIEDTVTSIRAYAFSRCLELSSVVIPSSVTYIGEWAFDYCNGLVAVFCYATTPPQLESEVFYGTNDCPIYVPAESVNAYKSAWADYSSRIQAMATDPVWTNQSSYCEIGQDGIRTGNKITIQKDVNPESSTYGQTRQTPVGQDLSVCYNATYFEKVEDVSEITDGTYILFDDSSQLILNVSKSKDTSSISTGLNSLNAETGSAYGPWYDNGYVYTTAERGFVYSTATNKATCNIEGTDYTICQYAIRGYARQYFGYSSNVYDTGRIYPYDVNGRIVFGTGNAKIGFDGSNFRWGADTSSMSVYKLVE